MLLGEQWVGQVPEKLLQKSSHTVHVVEEILRVPEVKLW